MPSPFPGMDPYLEAPAFFGDLHVSMITYLREALQGRLPEPYYAALSDRVWVEVERRFIEPDVNVLRGKPSRGGGKGAGAVATVPGPASPVVVHVPQEERREAYIEIFTRVENGEHLVTTVEMLSPANKAPGEQGRDLYLRKQR